MGVVGEAAGDGRLNVAGLYADSVAPDRAATVEAMEAKPMSCAECAGRSR